MPDGAIDAAIRGRAVRLAARTGQAGPHTAGAAVGNLQANLVILPEEHAADFRTYCRRNPKPCPLLGMTAPGDPGLPALGDTIDLRTDLPGYRIWRNGRLDAEVDEIAEFWREDFVGFAIGCSFSFEAALLDAGVHLRHLEQGCNVAMYVTSIQTEPAGPFSGPMVVSMRSIKKDDVERASAITAAAPNAHGAPIHHGAPEAIGILDLAKPDFGDAIEIHADETPVFWACGVTPQMALQHAKLPFAITHRPGAMLVTDLLTDQPPAAVA
jgi:uncharacterized protein YcsI (UPF0317 family)